MGSNKRNAFEKENESNTFLYAYKNPMYRRANSEFLTKKLRFELDRPLRPKDYCTKRLLSPISFSKLKKKHVQSGKPSRKKKYRTYTDMRRDREEFRKLLVSLIMGKEDEDPTDNTFPNKKERELLRYSYYIQHGIDTVHVAQMEKRVYNRILSLVPKRLLKYGELVNENVIEIKSEYEFAVKKAVIDFVLGGSLKENYNITENLSEERQGLKEAGIKFKHKIQENRIQVRRNLYTINPVLAHMLEMWQSTYIHKHFISTELLMNYDGSFDLAEFTELVSHQIDEMCTQLKTKWYDSIKNTLHRAMRRKTIPDGTKPKSLRRFFNCIAALMTQNLQDIAIRSLTKFTDFVCDIGKSNPGIRLHILLEDEDRLVFSPSFAKIQSELLRMIDNIVHAVQSFPRIETKIHSIPTNYSVKQLKPIIPEQFVDNCRYKLFEMLEEQRIGPELRLQDFDEYVNLMNGVDATDIYKFMSTSQDFEKYCELIVHYNDIENEIAMNVWSVVTMGLYEFHREGLIDTLETLAKFMQRELLQRMVSDQQTDVAKLQAEYEAISQRSLTVPKNTAELMESKAYVMKMENQVIPEMENRLKINLDHFLWLMDQTIYTPLEIKQNSMAFQWYLKMASVFKENRKIIDNKTVEYQELLKKRIEQFRRDLDVYWEQLLDYENWGEIELVSKYKKKANMLDSRLTAAMEKIERINEEESSYGWKLSEYSLRRETHDKLAPYKQLFDAGQDFIEKRDLWLNSQVGSFDPENISTDINVIYEVILNLEQKFEEHPHSKKLSEDIKSIIDEFKLNMPIIQTLGNPGMKLRHWEQISEMVGFPIKVSPELTLEKIIEFGLEDYLSRFVIISQSATKENNLELAMSKMVIEWQGIEFVINAYRDTGTYILSSVEDIQTLLDDHIIKTQTMKGSPYIKPFETEILAWEAKLVLLQDILDDWLRVQATWMYLEPIFTSPDIQQQMPEEGRRFSAVDKIWKDLMKQVQTDPAVMAVVDIDKMSGKLKKAFNLLEVIQKGLNTYLEKKRLYFPRFFFLSNDGLLEILAETKDPTRVQSHLRKCFDGIATLNFNESLEVTTMRSYQGEEIELTEAISTAKARGQVEKWLLDLETNMKKSVRQQIINCYEAYLIDEQMDWVQKWPGQCVHAISHTYWTNNITDCLETIDSSATVFQELSQSITDFINSLIDLLSANLTIQIRTTLQALIIIQVHCLDVSQNLIKNNVTSTSDFAWIGQLRYYMENENLITKMVNTSLPYGYEYLGNTKRLVVTPLTERCYRTIFSVLHYHFGCSLKGTASIGKNETIKDLAKAVAKQMVIFNCSNALDYLALGKFFKGLSSCGAWVCFTEFNRIKAEVLSVVAQQILLINRSINLGLNSFVFDGVSLQLDSSCAMFLTMSSGDVKFTQLPDNIKTFFRPISLMLPDFKLISEIELFSVGFKNAKLLSIKLITTIRLCSEFLSNQSHYDFGMRTLKTILRLSKSKKNEKFDENEDLILWHAINEANLSKLVNDDVPIFQNILSEIFSDVKIPENIDDNFIQAIKKACEDSNIQCTDYFVEKINQIFKQMQIRTGIMIIGEPFGGKTTMCRILAKALGILTEMGIESGGNVVTAVINPKSLTMGQLYGQFDASHEWRDGILAVRYRKFVQSITDDIKWLIFDGPIDPIWIEDMNTVLDDNKKLCLMSGEIIHLKEDMHLIFEPMDLDAASPSTVSRCGLIYSNPKSLGWEVIFHSWINTLPAAIQEVNKQEITCLIMRFCPILLWFIRNGSVSEMLDTSDANLISSLLNFFDCFLDEYNDEKYMSSLSELDIRAQLEGIFFFSCVWSLGGALNEQSRELFSELFQGLSNKEFPPELHDKFYIPDHLRVGNLQKPYIFAIPKKGNVFEYRFIKEGKGKWKLWSDEIALAPPLARDIPVNQIIITTVETVRICALLDLLVRHGKPVILVGPTATGKSIYAMDYLVKKIDNDLYTALPMNFALYSSANDTQDIIMAKLDKRRKGVFGPPLGKRCVIFIDDLSFPMKEPFGAQPSVEVLRMLLDHWMWYDRKDNIPFKLIDLQLMAALGPPSITGKSVTQRFTRHFNTIAIDEFTGDTLRSIFSKIVLWHLDARGFSKEFDPCIDEIVLGTLYIYTHMREILKPIPSKCHYVFNVRDFSRVIQGVLLSVPEATEGIDAMRRLWAHEILRVYGDRLIDPIDKHWLFDAICKVTENELHTNINDLFARFIEPGKQLEVSDFRQLMYCDFTNPKADTRNYLEVQDLEELKYVVEGYLVEFNNMTKRPMNLILFRYAVEHLSRICRVFKQPRSHLLMLGIGGCGRQSYIRLAAHIMDYEVFQIELSRHYSVKEWQDDLRAMLSKVSSGESHAVFLFADTQVQNEKYLQDICDLLSTGEVSNLLSVDEKLEIIEKMGQIDKQRDKSLQTNGTPTALYNFYLTVIREQLHITLCMSPDGHLKDYIRKFPAILNACTMNWLQTWPDDALLTVSTRFLAEEDLSESTRNATIQMCREFHKSSEILVDEFYVRFNRRNYVAPIAFLELIYIFKEKYKERKNVLLHQKDRYLTALKQLEMAAVQTIEMQKQIEELEPQMRTASERVTKSSAEVQSALEVAEEQREQVKQDESIATEHSATATELFDSCASIMADAMPLIHEAEAVLNALTPADIAAVKTMKNPPVSVKIVMEAICILKDIKPDKVSVGGVTTEEYWGGAKKLLNDPKFVENLLAFEKESIPVPILKKLQDKVFCNEAFDPEKVKLASVASESLCKWVIAVIQYEKAAKMVAPKRVALKEAEEIRDASVNQLNIKLEELRICEETLAEHQKEYNSEKDHFEYLKNSHEDCTKKLQRAQDIRSHVGSEKDRWAKAAEQMEENYKTLTGDVLVSSAIIAYLGLFNAELRTRQIGDWIAKCRDVGLSCNADFHFENIMGDPIETRAWMIFGLPNEEYSLQTAIITKNARRWPLMIDPESTANKWIKSMEKANRLCVIRFTQPDYTRVLENSIQYGLPVLLENVGEELEPMLDCVLLKQIFKQSGSMCVKLGDSVVEYNDAFRMYITTKLRNPVYTPELAVKVTILNCAGTLDGLQDQILAVTVARERPDLEAEKTQLIVQGAENKKIISEMEEKILESLSFAGHILEEETIVQTITTSKQQSNEVNEKQGVADVTEKQVDVSRLAYTPIASHSAVLYFTIADLEAIHKMYQYNLAWFLGLFTAAIDNTDKVDDVQQRIRDLLKYFTYNLYVNVCRSLYEKDKLLFSLMLAKNIWSSKGKIVQAEWMFLLTGGTLTETYEQSPLPWIADSTWTQIQKISKFDKFSNLPQDIVENEFKWKHFMQSSISQNESLPEPINSTIDQFQKLILFRTISSDRLVPAIQEFIQEVMGVDFVESPSLDLKSAYQHSNCCIPLIFILAPNADPVSEIFQFAEEQGFAKSRLITLSLGQNQGSIASKTIDEGVKNGSWVLLQNCHMAKGWMPTFELIFENLAPDATHPDFRLWLTTEHCDYFPKSILQCGVKMIWEPPTNLRSHLIHSYTSPPISQSTWFNTRPQSKHFKSLLYSICFFHAAVRERNKFGQIGWNVPYLFTDIDLELAISNLDLILMTRKYVDFTALEYVTAECVYGGRVFDNRDKRVLQALLTKFVGSDMLVEGGNNKFDESSDMYYCPREEEYDEYVRYIRNLPLNAPPSVFGLHDNANMFKDRLETDYMMNKILILQDRMDLHENTVNKLTADNAIADILEDILERLPTAFNINEATIKLNGSSQSAVNTFLIQEMRRYNNLLKCIELTSRFTLRAIKGLVQMSVDANSVIDDITNGQIPNLWLLKSYPSLKSLGGYIDDFLHRLEFIQQWYNNGPPIIIWLSGFYVTQSFLTAIQLNYTRKHGISIDSLTFDYLVATENDISTPPDDATFFNGLYLEGAGWCKDKQCLIESEQRVLHCEMPIMKIQPVRYDTLKPKHAYSCPVYKTALRYGVMDTSGNNSNFITSIPLECASDIDASHWILRGCALLCQLNH